MLVLLGVMGGLAPVAGLAKKKPPPMRTVKGVVFDEAQNPIEGATVELADLQTNKVVDIYSQEDGSYKFIDIRFDHDYTIKAMFKGLSSETRKISMFETRSVLNFNLTLTKPQK